MQDELNEALAEGVEEARRELIEEQLERANVHILAGHDFGRPLGDMKRGTARVIDSDDAIRFELDLPDEADTASYFEDVIREVRSKRAGGVSPGFRIPPSNVVPDAERLIPEPGNPAVSIREIHSAILYEMSIVSRPAYASTKLDLRSEEEAAEQAAAKTFDLGHRPYGCNSDTTPTRGGN